MTEPIDSSNPSEHTGVSTFRKRAKAFVGSTGGKLIAACTDGTLGFVWVSSGTGSFLTNHVLVGPVDKMREIGFDDDEEDIGTVRGPGYFIVDGHYVDDNTPVTVIGNNPTTFSNIGGLSILLISNQRFESGSQMSDLQVGNVLKDSPDRVHLKGIEIWSN